MASKSDGTVYINTKIDTSGIDRGMSTTQNKINSVRKSLNSFGEAVKNAFSGSAIRNGGKTAVADYDKEIKKLEAQLDRLIEKQIRFYETGGDRKSRTFAGMEYDIEFVRNKLEELRAKQAEVAKGANTKQSSIQFQRLGDALKRVGQTAGNALSNILKFADNALNAGLKKLNGLFKKLASSLFAVEKGSKKSGYSMAKMLGSSVLFSAVFKAINTVTTGFKDGLSDLAEHSDALNKSLSSLKSTLLGLRNSFVAAFAPLIQVAIPYIEKFISYVNQALNYVAQFVAALFGQETYKKALKVSESIDGTSSSLDGVKDSANEAKKALQGYLSPLDEISRYTSETIEVSGVEDVGSNSPMFEDVAVDSVFKDMADKFKSVLSSLFDPLKEAWDKAGKFVMDSWLFALDEAWKLIKDIGRDFLEVWNQAETVDIFEDILRIIGDIGLVVGILAGNFREAWNDAGTGKRILEGIRDIIGVITDNILHAADATVEWAKGIDFTPLLTKIEGLVSSLVPVFDNLSGILTDFYEHVLLPLGEWVLEKGLPELLQVFIDFNHKVDWKSLRARLEEFWKALEPFAETVGEGLILFIERIANSLAGFVNSGEFDDFLTTIEEWMKNVKPKDVADGLENLAKSLIALKAAVVGFSAISKGLDAISKLGTVLGGLGRAVEKLKGIQIVPFLTQLFSSMNPGMIGEIGIKLSDLLNGSFLDPREWNNWMGDLANSFHDWTMEVTDSIGQAILFVFDAIAQIFIDTFNWDAVMALFEDPKAIFKEGGVNIILGVIEGILSAIGLIPQPIDDFFVGLWNAFCERFGAHSPAEEMKPLGEYIILGIIEGMKLVFDRIRETIDEIKVIFSTKLEEIAATVNEKFAAIKDSIFSKIAEIKSNWNSSWDEFANKVKSVWDTIKSTISGAVDRIKGWISDLLSSFSEVSQKSSSLSSKKSGKTYSFSSSFSNITIPSFSSLKIPHLAAGSVIPPNAPFLAVLGDQKRGTNIEAPEDLIRKIVREESGNNNASGNVTIPVYIDGNKLFEMVIDKARLLQASTGKNVLAELG